MTEDGEVARKGDDSRTGIGEDRADSPYESVEQLNEAMWRQLGGLQDSLCQSGVSSDEAIDRALELIDKVQTKSTPDFAEQLLVDGRSWVEDMREYASSFEERLRSYWGDALDLYMVIVGIVEWASKACIARNRERTKAEPDALFDVLAQLNGQALRVAREVYALLSSGYGLGALALSRTLSEIAVRACVLSEYGRVEGHDDLAERFVLHDRVINLRDAIIYQRDAETLGYEPFEEEYIARLEAEQKRLVELYGKEYNQPYGWAVGLPGVTHGRDFRMLETLAKTAHRRGLYQWSSHIVHADAKALRLGRLKRGGASTVLTGASNVALADPADHALYALNLTFIQFVTSALPMPAPVDLYIAQALGVLVKRAQEELGAAEKRVDEAEERLQAALAEEGQRMTPWGIQGMPAATGAGGSPDGGFQTRGR